MGNRPAERSLFELYQHDPERADALVFGRRTATGRRGFLKGAGLASMGAMLGATIPFHRYMPAGFIPVALADTMNTEGMDGLHVVKGPPLKAETPVHLLDDPVTPTARHYVSNHGIPPKNVDEKEWVIAIDGEVEKPLKLSLADLKKNFDLHKRALVIENAQNGNAFFDPATGGHLWRCGAVGCSEWTGVRLGDVLKAAGVKPSAVYTGHEGADTHVSGDPSKLVQSRGLPIAKAMEPNTLIAFEQNGEPLRPQYGAPVRLVASGYPGSCSHKWLSRVWVRDKVHDGAGMETCRLPKRPVAPGEKVDAKDMVIIEEMPVKSLITSPQTGARPAGGNVEVRGHAWGGAHPVTDLAVSYDFGQTWHKAQLDPPINPFAWQNWRTNLQLPQPGYYEIWARATNDQGISQPHAVIWNPGGYVNNAMHRVAVTVD